MLGRIKKDIEEDRTRSRITDLRHLARWRKMLAVAVLHPSGSGCVELSLCARHCYRSKRELPTGLRLMRFPGASVRLASAWSSARKRCGTSSGSARLKLLLALARSSTDPCFGGRPSDRECSVGKLTLRRPLVLLSVWGQQGMIAFSAESGQQLRRAKCGRSHSRAARRVKIEKLNAHTLWQDCAVRG